MTNMIEERTMLNHLTDLTHHAKNVEVNMRPKHNALKPESKEHVPVQDVSLSQTSKQLDALKAHILSEPEMNHAKIAFIKEALEEGRYQTNATQIAKNMLIESV